MNTMNTFVNILSGARGSTAGKYTLYAYCGFVVLGFLKGSITGTSEYCKWFSSRKKVTIESEFYDPILNVCRDAGVWGSYTMYGGFGSAFIVATSPVTVPLMLRNCKEVGDKDN